MASPRSDLLAPANRRPSPWPTFRAAMRTGWVDFTWRYTWWSWTIGWLLRCLCEVAFYGLIGRVIGSPGTAMFLVVGRGMHLGVQEVMWVIQSSAWERGTGTLPLLVSAPGRVWPAFAGRSTQWIPSACATSAIALLGIGPLFGVRYDLSGIATVLLAVPCAVLSGFGLAMPVAALVLRRPAWRNLASNITHSLMAVISGVLVPVSFWPIWVQAIAQALPVTHALRGLRAGLADGFINALPQLALALAIGAAWATLGARLIERLAENGRRDGTVDLYE